MTAGAAHAPGRKTVIGITSLGAFLAFLDVTIVNVAFPDIRAAFRGSSLETLSWVLNAYNVVFAALLVPAGRYADSIGRKRAFAGGVALFAASSLVAAVAPSAGVLIAARVAQAVGAAVIVPTSLALLLGVFGIGQRATAVALWAAAGAVAAATGPTLGGALVSAFDWRLIFLVNVPLGVLTLVLVARLPDEPAADRVRVPDPLGIALLTAGMALLALGVVQGNDWGWSSAAIVGSLSAGVVLLALFGRRSVRRENPAVDIELLRDRSCAIANLGTLLFATAFYGMLLTNVLFLTDVWGYSAIEAGLALTPAPLMAAIFAAAAGRVADRSGQKVVILPGVVLYVIGTLYLLGSAGPQPDYVAHFLPAACLMGVGIGLAFPALSSAAVASLDALWFATGSAINAAARQIGAVIGIAVVVSVISAARGAGGDGLEGYQDAWLVLALFCGAVGPVAVLWPRPPAATAEVPPVAAAARGV